jgi:hypothetical protein
VEVEEMDEWTWGRSWRKEQEINEFRAKARQRDEVAREKLNKREKFNDYVKKILHPDLFRESTWVENFSESFTNAVSEGTPESFFNILTRESESDIFSFDFLKPEFCAKILEEVQNFRSEYPELNVPNSMNNYGVVLDEMGLYSVLQVKFLRFLFFSYFRREIFKLNFFRM